MDPTQAIRAVAEHIHEARLDYPTIGLVADRFEAGWSIYAPVEVDASDPTAFLDMPVGRAIFLIGDSGRIEQVSSSTPPRVARQRFAEQELILACSRLLAVAGQHAVTRAHLTTVFAAYGDPDPDTAYNQLNLAGLTP